MLEEFVGCEGSGGLLFVEGNLRKFLELVHVGVILHDLLVLLLDVLKQPRYQFLVGAGVLLLEVDFLGRALFGLLVELGLRHRILPHHLLELLQGLLDLAVGAVLVVHLLVLETARAAVLDDALDSAG